MSTFRRLLAAVRNLLFKSRTDHDLNEELQSYVDLVADEHVQAGADAVTALRAGRMAVDGLEATKEAVRQRRAGAGIDRFAQDVRYALRGLRRSPGFAAAAIVVLALGIGANSAMFSVADAAMFKPLPYSHPEQLVHIAAVFNAGSAEETRQVGLSWNDLDQWRAERQVFSQSATSGRVRVVNIPEIAASGRTFIGSVSPELLELFGVRPRVGRWFVGDDVRSSRPVVLLTETVWKNAFGSDPYILGRTITIDRVPYAIVGIMPRTFMWAVGNPASTIGWVPYDEEADRRNRVLSVRLRDGGRWRGPRGSDQGSWPRKSSRVRATNRSTLA